MIISYLSSLILAFLIYILLGKKPQEGELTVTGTNYIYVVLLARPESVQVAFVDEEQPVPCNPSDHDTLTWKLVSVKEGFFSLTQYYLRIDWSVVNSRKIKWEVWY